MDACMKQRAPRRRATATTAVAFIFALLALLSTTAAAQENPARTDERYQIGYQLSMPNPASHLFEVTMTVEPQQAVEAVDFQMPRWSPGRYAVFDFAKNVQEVRATTFCAPPAFCDAATLSLTRLDTQTWRVYPGKSRGVAFTYKVFANDLSGTFSQLDARHANFNGGSIFMYVVGHKPDPVRLKINAPSGWRIINAASRGTDQREWQFPNYDILIDTPTEIAPDFTVDEFKLDGKTYRVMVHSFGEEKGRRAELVERIERLVRSETAMMGTPDYDSYTFLMHFDPTAPRGDGMEHLASTQIITTRALGDKDALEAAVDTASHEFFHVWNVKRLRPVELGPWDFTRPLNTRSLWIAEGLTNYYGHLMQRRAGIWSDAQLERELGQAIAVVENAPGSRLMSAEEASLIAPFIDRGQSAQQTNLRETSISYYNKGEVVGIVLDLLIRGRTRGRASLDDVMRRMYEEFYLRSPQTTYYLRGRGYTGADFERAASQVAGTDLSDFFARHVGGVEPLPYDEALAYVGLKLVKTPAKTATTTTPTPQPAATQTPPRTRYEFRIEEIKDAPAEARALRTAWLKG
jgi:predicted metalloprotease with PDZ domain